MTERPGSASVQYGDVRGHAAADIADEDGNMLDDAARALGLKACGRVVGMSIYHGLLGMAGSREEKYIRKVTVTFQVIADSSIGCGADEINANLAKRNGVLPVKKYMMDVDVIDLLRHFKRLDIGLFSRHIQATEIDVVARDGESE